MRTLIALTIAVLTLVPAQGIATSAFAAGTPICPEGTTLTKDQVTGMDICMYPYVKVAGGHPAYDYQADCVPGTVIHKRVDIPGGYRIVDLVCQENFQQK